MRLYFKQRVFSWFDSYDVFDESGKVCFRICGELALGHSFIVYDKTGKEVARLKEKLLTMLPVYSIYMDNVLVTRISQKMTLFKSRFVLEGKNWDVRGDFFSWNYQIFSPEGVVATMSKKLISWQDACYIEVNNPEDALMTLLVVVAIDAAECSRKS